MDLCIGCGLNSASIKTGKPLRCMAFETERSIYVEKNQ